MGRHQLHGESDPAGRPNPTHTGEHDPRLAVEHHNQSVAGMRIAQFRERARARRRVEKLEDRVPPRRADDDMNAVRRERARHHTGPV
ncbi:hypothetical protein [Mycobacterium neglectum]|uniref:hypothetical protein n=1 Tax=Mycobacterium neglectum TaxID=242737 RepID=UPI000BFEBD7C|nr:hypothetical protein [Mycobacterium neglectum]